jgi:hypothetical protein
MTQNPADPYDVKSLSTPSTDLAVIPPEQAPEPNPKLKRKVPPERAKSFREPVNITPDEAYAMFEQLGRPSINALYEYMKTALNAAGEPIKASRSWVQARARKDDWGERYTAAHGSPDSVSGDKTNPNKILNGLNTEGLKLSVATFRGLQARAITVMWHNLKKLELTRPEQFISMAQFIAAINQEIHHARASDIGAADRAPHAGPQVIANGVFNLGEFKDIRKK